MQPPLTHILVFKTTIKTPADKRRVEAMLNTQVGIQAWTVDIEDVDCVLRIVSATLSPPIIINLINSHGFSCAELD